jgi:polyhydroxyalkanoate synthase
LPADPEAWLRQAVEHPGSWWTDWINWLATHGGRKVKAKKQLGGGGHKAMEPAPGLYVKEKAA